MAQRHQKHRVNGALWRNLFDLVREIGNLRVVLWHSQSQAESSGRTLSPNGETACAFASGKVDTNKSRRTQ